MDCFVLAEDKTGMLYFNSSAEVPLVFIKSPAFKLSSAEAPEQNVNRPVIVSIS